MTRNAVVAETPLKTKKPALGGGRLTGWTPNKGTAGRPSGRRRFTWCHTTGQRRVGSSVSGCCPSRNRWNPRTWGPFVAAFGRSGTRKASGPCPPSCWWRTRRWPASVRTAPSACSPRACPSSGPGWRPPGTFRPRTRPPAASRSAPPCCAAWSDSVELQSPTPSPGAPLSLPANERDVYPFFGD